MKKWGERSKTKDFATTFCYIISHKLAEIHIRYPLTGYSGKLLSLSKTIVDNS